LGPSASFVATKISVLPSDVREDCDLDRHEHIGEGGYDAIEEEEAALLTEAAGQRDLRTEAG
jgi:hypothetical protein